MTNIRSHHLVLYSLSFNEMELPKSLKLGKPKMPASKPRKDEGREMPQAIVEDADKTEGKDRDLVHGGGASAGRKIARRQTTRSIAGRLRRPDLRDGHPGLNGP
jgi:hypothetical protein